VRAISGRGNMIVDNHFGRPSDIPKDVGLVERNYRGEVKSRRSLRVSLVLCSSDHFKCHSRSRVGKSRRVVTLNSRAEK